MSFIQLSRGICRIQHLYQNGFTLYKICHFCLYMQNHDLNLPACCIDTKLRLPPPLTFKSYSHKSFILNIILSNFNSLFLWSLFLCNNQFDQSLSCNFLFYIYIYFVIIAISIILLKTVCFVIPYCIFILTTNTAAM